MVLGNSITFGAVLLILTGNVAMPQQTPTSTVRALYDAVRKLDWTSAAALADSESLVAWHRDERASLANLPLPLGPEALDGADTVAVDAILNQSAHVALPLPGGSVTTVGAIGSLTPRAYLIRLWDVHYHLFGRANPKAPEFETIAEVPQKDGSVRVQYRGYLGVGGGMPEPLELRPQEGGWRYVVAPELTSRVD